MARRRSRQAAEPTAATTPPPQGGAYRPLHDRDCVAIVEHAFAVLSDVGLAGAPASARARRLPDRHAGVSGYVAGRDAAADTGFTIDMFGTPCPATRHRQPVYDPEHQRPRS